MTTLFSKANRIKEMVEEGNRQPQENKVNPVIKLKIQLIKMKQLHLN